MSYIVFVGYIHRSWLVGPCQCSYLVIISIIVENPFRWTILWFVLQMTFLPFIIMRCVISLHSLSVRCVLVSLWSYLYMQPLSGETFTRWCAIVEDCARADLHAGFLVSTTGCLFDVRLFYPNASSNWASSCLLCIESMKKGSMPKESEWWSMVFSPPCFCASGGMAHEATIFIRDLQSDSVLSRRNIIQWLWAV